MNKEQIRQYVVSTIFSLIIFALFAYYNSLQLQGLSPRVYNRALADTSIVLLGIALSLGMLSRLYEIWDKFLTYRKELGILAFFAGASHVYLSMFPLARSGPWGFYNYKPLSAYPGLAGLLIMFFLFLISAKLIEKSLGTKTWWKLQYIGGRLAGLAVLIHLIVLRGSTWPQIIQSSTSTPPSHLITGSFAIFILISRLLERLNKKLAKWLIPLLAITIIILIIK